MRDSFCLEIEFVNGFGLVTLASQNFVGQFGQDSIFYCVTLVELVVAFNNLSGLGSVHNSEKLGVRGVSYKSKCRASASALCNAYVIKRDVAAVGFFMSLYLLLR